jgi:hypothetical protein
LAIQRVEALAEAVSHEQVTSRDASEPSPKPNHA